MRDDKQIPYLLTLPQAPADAPLFITSPHSGREYPAAFLKSALLDAHEIRQSEDMYVDELFAHAPRLGVGLLSARFPRAYIDLNRAPYELEQKLFTDKLPDHIDTRSPRASAGLGTVPRLVAENTPIYKDKLSFAEAEQRIEQIYRPFHETVQSRLADLQDAHGYSFLLDTHSMPSQATKLSDRMDVDFILGNRHGRACHPDLTDMVATFLKTRGWQVGLNKPYAGGYITEQYGTPAQGSHALQIEINRASYMDEASHEKHDGFDRLQNDMTDLVAHLVASLPDMTEMLAHDSPNRSAAE